MPNYKPPAKLRGKLTTLDRAPGIAARSLSYQAMVSRLSVSQVVGSAATARAQVLVRHVPYISVAQSPTKDRISNGPELQAASSFKSHALSLTTASVPKSFTCCASRGSA